MVRSYQHLKLDRPETSSRNSSEAHTSTFPYIMTSTVTTTKPLQDISHNIPSPLKSTMSPLKSELKKRQSPDHRTPESKAAQRRRLSSEEPNQDEDLKDIFSLTAMNNRLQDQQQQTDKSRLVTETRLLGVLEFNTIDSTQSIQNTTTTTTTTTTKAPSNNTEGVVKETRSIHDSIFTTRKHHHPHTHLQQYQVLPQRRPLMGMPARRAATTTPEPVPSAVTSNEKEIQLARQIEKLQLEGQYNDWLHQLEVDSWRETVDFLELEKKFMIST